MKDSPARTADSCFPGTRTQALGCILLALTLAGCASGTKARVNQDLWPATRHMPSASGDASRLKAGDLPAAALLEEGKANLREANYEVAEFYFAAVLNKSSDSVDALVGLGESQWAQGRVEEAGNAYRRALALQPSAVPALAGLGKIARANGKHEESLGYLKQAVEADPENPRLLEELAFTYEASGRLQDAEPLFRLVVEKTGKARAYNNLGFNLISQGRHADAVSLLERATLLEPDNVRARNNLGVAYAMTGDWDKAFQLFESTMGRAAAYNNLGYFQMLQGNWKEAEASLLSAIEESPSFYVKARENLDRLGQMLYAKSKEDLARLKASRAAEPAQ